MNCSAIIYLFNDAVSHENERESYAYAFDIKIGGTW